MNKNNIFLYEVSQDALDEINSGKAKLSSGGIIRIGSAGKGFHELAKPVSMSVADLETLFESKEHALLTDEQLSRLDSKLALSEEGLREIQRTEWLNYEVLQRNYILTYKGFVQTVNEIKIATKQLKEFELYVRKRDVKDLNEKMQVFINYMNSDVGDLRSKKYSPTNGKIGEHLDQISALIERLINDIETEDGDLFFSFIMLIKLLQPFAFVVKLYSAAYFYENDGELMPGNYEKWVNIISEVSKSKKFKDFTEYYIKLKTELPYREKILLSRMISDLPSKALASIEFERHYISNHSKEEYLSIGDQICRKIESKDYRFIKGKLCIFLVDE